MKRTVKDNWRIRAINNGLRITVTNPIIRTMIINSEYNTTHSRAASKNIFQRDESKLSFSANTWTYQLRKKFQQNYEYPPNDLNSTPPSKISCQRGKRRNIGNVTHARIIKGQGVDREIFATVRATFPSAFPAIRNNIASRRFPYTKPSATLNCTKAP